MRGILVVNFLLTCIIGLCPSYVAGEDSVSKPATQNQTCNTTGCIAAARSILKNMDATVNPCDDFYQFACGNYLKGSEWMSGSVLGTANEKLQSQLKESIEDKIDEGDPRTLRLIKSHYNICRDTEKIERNSTGVLLDNLRKLGGWPVLDGETWNESAFDWKRLTYQLSRVGYRNSMYSFVVFGAVMDSKSNDKYVITLDQAKTGLVHEFLSDGVENEVVQAYHRYMTKIASALGVSKQRARKELADSLNFEIALSKISLPGRERRNMSLLYNPVRVDELDSKYPGTPWREFLNELIKPYYNMTSTDQVIVRNPQFLKSISELISKTPKRVLANYAVWRAVQESVPYLNRRLRRIQGKFNEDMMGVDVQLPRSELCITYVKENVPLAVGALYVRKAFDKNFKKEGEMMVGNLRLAFKNSLEKVDWMDERTKSAALKKLNSMPAHVAYPDELLDNEKLDKYYESLKLSPDSYLDSYLSVGIFEVADTFLQLAKPYNRTDWVRHASSADFNAYYIYAENSIQITAGFFQEELFRIHTPKYLNYAGLGYFIGHEFTHGFDNKGSQYDEDGKVFDWWDSKTHEEYEKRAQCIVDQYSNYTVAEVELKIDGINTEMENIADNGGIKQAYFAYEEYKRRSGPELSLPGLSFSPRQLFWLSHANIYCEKNTPEMLQYQIATDDHCPGKYRVIGALANMPEFAKDFNCPLGSPMNPVKKCTVW